MGMTMTQKILARAAGLEQVQAGQLIEAQLDPLRRKLKLPSLLMKLRILRQLLLQQHQQLLQSGIMGYIFEHIW